ncbi:site-specific integrase [bacterium]|nr:MAG: site-specific integrase [bacterium]
MARRNAVQLTQKIVQSFQYECEIKTDSEGKRIEPRCVKWDLNATGLGLRVYPSGKKVWVFAYEVEGRKRLIQFDTPYPTLTLDGARAAAKALGGKIATADALNADPVDPLADRERKKDDRNISELCEAYLERHAAQKKTGKEDKRRIKLHILPAWGTLKIKAIRRSDVASLHHKIGESGQYEANRVLALVSVLFEKAREWGFLPDAHSNPARDVQTFREVKRDRWIKPEELPKLALAINKEPNVYIRALILAYLLTGARKSELLNAKWEDLDFERNELRLPDTKAGRVHYIPLSAPAKALFDKLPREEGNPHVFPGRKEKTHLVNIGKSWRRIRQEAELEDVRLHDLRRTVGSWLATSGASLPLIGKVLGHTQPSTTAIYARLGEDPARKALEDHGERMMEAAQGLRLIK